MTGYGPEEPLGKNSRLLTSGEQDVGFHMQMWNTILAGQFWHGELVNRRKDGTLYTEEMRATPVRDVDGAIVQYIAIKQDMTDRRAAEEASDSWLRSWNHPGTPLRHTP
jgi:PAS domain S-box-containing protein